MLAVSNKSIDKQNIAYCVLYEQRAARGYSKHCKYHDTKNPIFYPVFYIVSNYYDNTSQAYNFSVNIVALTFLLI